MARRAPATAEAPPLSAAEGAALLSGLVASPGLVVAVSGGPDSTALLLLVAGWRRGLSAPPPVLAVTVDHGLRPESAAEAAGVASLAAGLGLPHRTLCWRGAKPKTGLAAAARAARYRLLAAAAHAFGATHILTAHSLDDQAETVLMRLLSGSGPAGLAGMAGKAAIDPQSGLPPPPPPASASAAPAPSLWLVRPLLTVPKARLIATCAAAGVSFAEDPTNADPRFTRVRLRRLMAGLGPEGLSAAGLVRLAERSRRAELALQWAVARAAAEARLPGSQSAPENFDAARLCALPAELSLRLLRAAVEAQGREGAVELGKLEALHGALAAAGARGRLRRTLAGALVTLAGGRVAVAPAPPRRKAVRRSAASEGIFTTTDADSAHSLGRERAETYIAPNQRGAPEPSDGAGPASHARAHGRRTGSGSVP